VKCEEKYDNEEDLIRCYVAEADRYIHLVLSLFTLKSELRKQENVKAFIEPEVRRLDGKGVFSPDLLVIDYSSHSDLLEGAAIDHKKIESKNPSYIKNEISKVRKYLTQIIWPEGSKSFKVNIKDVAVLCSYDIWLNIKDLLPKNLDVHIISYKVIENAIEYTHETHRVLSFKTMILRRFFKKHTRKVRISPETRSYCFIRQKPPEHFLALRVYEIALSLGTEVLKEEISLDYETLRVQINKFYPYYMSTAGQKVQQLQDSRLWQALRLLEELEIAEIKGRTIKIKRPKMKRHDVYFYRKYAKYKLSKMKPKKPKKQIKKLKHDKTITLNHFFKTNK